MNEARNGKKCSEETATIGISEWVVCCPSFSKKVVRTSRRREMFGLDMKLSRACPYLPVKNDFPVARLFPITIINAATVQRAFLVSVHVMHPAKQTCVSCLQGKGFLLLHSPTNCANSPTAPSVPEPVRFTELNLTYVYVLFHAQKCVLPEVLARPVYIRPFSMCPTEYLLFEIIVNKNVFMLTVSICLALSFTHTHTQFVLARFETDFENRPF